jgi:hypothetical protein
MRKREGGRDGDREKWEEMRHSGGGGEEMMDAWQE